MFKRLFDIIFSLAGLIFLLPVLLYVAIRIKSDSKGTIFYKGTRAGKNAKPFKMWKFRTMFEDAHLMPGGPSSGDDDPRITNYGKHLRKSKLNEIPQLINVLKGEMSFVGPRPEVPSEVELYTKEERQLLTVRPGVTDYASIEFHNEGEILSGSPDPHQTYREKIRPGKIKLGLEYVNNHSFWIDLKILFKTFSTLF